MEVTYVDLRDGGRNVFIHGFELGPGQGPLSIVRHGFIIAPNSSVVSGTIVQELASQSAPVVGLCHSLMIHEIAPGDSAYKNEHYRFCARPPGGSRNGLVCAICGPSRRPGAGFGCPVRPAASVGAIGSEKEMLTPKGEHLYPLFSQGDVRWENQLRRNRNRQNFVVGSYFPWRLKSRKNRARNFRP